MINKVQQDWEKLGQALERTSGSDLEVREVLKHIGGVREVLKRMCQVSVTRTSLKNAVRDALLPVLHEHRDELFPELQDFAAVKAGLSRQKGAAAPSLTPELRGKILRFEERISQLTELQSLFTDLSGQVSSVDEKVQRLQDRLSAAEGQLRTGDQTIELMKGELKSAVDEVTSSRQRLAGLDERLLTQGSEQAALQERVAQHDTRLSAADEKLGSVDEQLQRTDERFGQVNGRIGQVEGHVSKLEVRFEELEKTLRKEIDEMVQSLMDKFAVVREVLERMESTMPHKNAVSTANERLQVLQERVDAMSQKVDNIDSVTPEVRGVGQQFEGLRNRISELSGSVSSHGNDLGELQNEFNQRLIELTDLLSAGISRWESDQSQSLERLSSIRDSLRDQLRDVGKQVDDAQKGFMGKLRRSGGLNLSRDEWDQLAGRMEGIIGGLESVLAQKKTDVQPPTSSPEQ